jgi:hypothetical protein
MQLTGQPVILLVGQDNITETVDTQIHRSKIPAMPVA